MKIPPDKVLFETPKVTLKTTYLQENLPPDIKMPEVLQNLSILNTEKDIVEEVDATKDSAGALGR